MKLEAQGDFNFVFYIEKAVPSGVDGDMVIEGVASTINVDHDNERFAPDALVSMANIINEKSVPLRVEHQKADNAVVGSVFEARVDERNQLWIKARLDKDHAASGILYSALKQGTKLGLSVGGKVKKAVKELVESTGKMIKTFYDVELDEVSLTMRPSNYDAWLITKSIKEKAEDVEKYYDTPFYQEFLFENPHLDYMRSFAKAVPDKAWRKVDSPADTIISKDMEKKEINKASAEETEETKTKASSETEETKEKAAGDEKTEDTEMGKGYATKEELKSLGNLMSKGFDNLVNILSNIPAVAKMTESAMDQEDPDEKKKSASDEDETKEKAASDETEEKTKATKEDTDHEYEIESTVKSSIDAVEALNKKLQGVKKTPDEEDTEAEKATKDEEETTKSQKDGSEIDQFVSHITEFAKNITEKLEKDNIRVPGLERMIADMVRNDPEIQKSIKEMVQQPGIKKSVVAGVPWMPTKEGKRLALIAVAPEKVQKSEAKGSFKELYQERFSSFSEEGQE